MNKKSNVSNKQRRKVLVKKISDEYLIKIGPEKFTRAGAGAVVDIIIHLNDVLLAEKLITKEEKNEVLKQMMPLLPKNKTTSADPVTQIMRNWTSKKN